jgi:nicotinate-nucleotide pyrophosphorylase (carboxylating)
MILNGMDRFLEEDIGLGDVTTELLVPDVSGDADIVCEEDAVLAGIEEASAVFEKGGVTCRPKANDGGRVKRGDIVMELSGPLRSIITLERTALNIMMRMSGIATAVDGVIAMCTPVNRNIRISGTRKTAPGLRMLDKKAVAAGGGLTHRSGLYDMILVKDNHIKAAGGMENVISILRSRDLIGKAEIEVENIDDAVTAAKGGAGVIMIDNASPSEAAEIAEAVRRVSKAKIEVSGNITKDNAHEYAEFADIISMGSLTHSVRAVHFSLNVR